MILKDYDAAASHRVLSLISLDSPGATYLESAIFTSKINVYLEPMSATEVLTSQ